MRKVKFSPNKRNRPEAKIEREIKKYLEARGWYVRHIEVPGMPDIFATHKQFGMRWIEVKLPQMKGSKFTKRQKEEFPKLILHGAQIYIITEASASQYKMLFNVDDKGRPVGNAARWLLEKG
jgi:Holliday junction resolvase|tara:strand:+ start:698 stop:1063 length:366 start_codon:yes stop_codon:yes gene_type:complete